MAVIVIKVEVDVDPARNDPYEIAHDLLEYDVVSEEKVQTSGQKVSASFLGAEWEK